MASFEGIKWSDGQMKYSLIDKRKEMAAGDDKTFAVSRSIHYGLFLVFEGIRYFCFEEKGKKKVVFVNWRKNLERFRNGMIFNLAGEQHRFIPTVEELEGLIMSYFRHETLAPFIDELAATGTQGYLRPFTVDEEQSIGVTFPRKPTIRLVTCLYKQYLGEPFSGVVVPHLVRAIDVNGTGCLKLGVNYLMSVKAVAEAQDIEPGASSALFLDDRPDKPLRERRITEWDSSCCLIGLDNGGVVKIPESNLILPSVTIEGLARILRHKGVDVIERDMTYGELIEGAAAGKIAALCSVGTAGIINRCDKLTLIDEKREIIGKHLPLKDHPLWHTLGELKDYYWDMYRGRAEVPAGIERNVYEV